MALNMFSAIPKICSLQPKPLQPPPKTSSPCRGVLQKAKTTQQLRCGVTRTRAGSATAPLVRAKIPAGTPALGTGKGREWWEIHQQHTGYFIKAGAIPKPGRHRCLQPQRPEPLDAHQSVFGRGHSWQEPREGCRSCSVRFSSSKQTSGLNKLFVKLAVDKQEAVCQAEGGLAGLRRAGWDLSAEIFSR